MLLNDSAEPSQQVNATNELEAELLKKVADMDNVLQNEGLGVINQNTPSSYFNLLCYLIGYKTGTSLIDVKALCLFDFICYLHIIKLMDKDGESDIPQNTPEGKDQMRMIGGM